VLINLSIVQEVHSLYVYKHFCTDTSIYICTRVHHTLCVCMYIFVACTNHAAVAIEVRKIVRVKLGKHNLVHVLDKSSRNVVKERSQDFEVRAR
jgi:hypothetical protein